MLALKPPQNNLTAQELEDATSCISLQVNHLLDEPRMHLLKTRWFKPSTKVIRTNVTRWHSQEAHSGIPQEEWQWRDVKLAVLFPPSSRTQKALAEWQLEHRRLIWEAITGHRLSPDGDEPDWHKSKTAIDTIQHTLLADLLTRTGDLK